MPLRIQIGGAGQNPQGRKWWDVKHVVGSLQIGQGSVTTAGIRFPQSVSYKPLCSHAQQRKLKQKIVI
jgi:hypothetical protein